MVDNKTLAQEISKKIPYELTDDRILVKPLKPVMVTKLLPVAPASQAGKTVAEIESAEPAEPQKQKVEANMRRGIIVKLGREYTEKNPEGYEVGDVVIYPTYAGVNFELFKDTRTLRRYEVIAVEATPAA